MMRGVLPSVACGDYFCPSLAGNGIGPEGAEALSSALMKNQVIETVVLTGNDHSHSMLHARWVQHLGGTPTRSSFACILSGFAVAVQTIR